jgi:hypothetical protein
VFGICLRFLSGGIVIGHGRRVPALPTGDLVNYRPVDARSRTRRSVSPPWRSTGSEDVRAVFLVLGHCSVILANLGGDRTGAWRWRWTNFFKSLQSLVILPSTLNIPVHSLKNRSIF